MNFTQGIKMALNSIFSNKLRSFLTMLGIIIGVSAVISLVSLGQGATNQVTEQVQNLGSNLLTVNIMGRGTQTSLEYEEVEQWTEKPGIQAVSPVISGQVKAKYGNNNVDVTLEGTNPEYESVQDFHVQQGRFLLPVDIEYMQKVALLGSNTAKELFGFVNPVGESIQINGARFEVVGLLEEKGSSMGRSNDDKILIPVSTAERILMTKGVKTAYVQTDSPDQVNLVIGELEQELKKKFRDNEDSYSVLNQQDMLDSMSSITNTLTLALAGIAGISLLVGGIGIMNIMLVSVTERTREIGIRKAIGAKKRDILTQFLIESVALSGLGGILGIMIGAGGALLISNLINIGVVISINVVLLAFGFSVCVGILFGLFPANKAANLKPIEALRFE
jgi:putative ABC transport system permease protein